MPSAFRRGFTPIELLIVLVIIGVLAAIPIPKLRDSKRKVYVAAMRLVVLTGELAAADDCPDPRTCAGTAGLTRAKPPPPHL